jgi:hypothetical protein
MLMRQQVAGKPSNMVSGSEPGRELGMETGTEELDRRMSDLVQAGYLEEIDNTHTASYLYRITQEGMDIALKMPD